MMTSYGWWLMRMTHRRLNWTHWSFCQVPEIRKIRIKWTSIRRRYDWSKMFSILRNCRFLEIGGFGKSKTLWFDHGNSGPQKILGNNGQSRFTASDWSDWLADFRPIRGHRTDLPKNDEAITGTGQKWIWLVKNDHLWAWTFLWWVMMMTHFVFTVID